MADVDNNDAGSIFGDELQHDLTVEGIHAESNYSPTVSESEELLHFSKQVIVLFLLFLLLIIIFKSNNLTT